MPQLSGRARRGVALVLVFWLLCVQQMLASHVHAGDHEHEHGHGEVAQSCTLCVFSATGPLEHGLLPECSAVAPPACLKARAAAAPAQRAALQPPQALWHARGPPP